MDDVLMMYDLQWEDCHLKEYLQVGGYRITEMNIFDVELFKKNSIHKDIVLVICAKPSEYFDLCREIRACTQLPIMIISKTDDEWSKIMMFRSGADDYLAEPIQEMALIARIQAHIKQFRRLTRFFGYIKTRDLVIEALSRRVYINDIEVNLTFKEFDILLYMAQRPNSAVTREELYTAVWSQKLIQGYADTITTYIMRLRQKIEVDPDNPKYLETIWGVGYRFVL